MLYLILLYVCVYIKQVHLELIIIILTCNLILLYVAEYITSIMVFSSDPPVFFGTGRPSPAEIQLVRGVGLWGRWFPPPLCHMGQPGSASAHYGHI